MLLGITGTDGADINEARSGSDYAEFTSEFALVLTQIPGRYSYVTLCF
jgi:hypothetical protein